MGLSPNQKTPEQICRAIKGHIEGVREELRGLYSDPAPPQRVRETAKAALKELNQQLFRNGFEFDELHNELGLGPADWFGPCGHEGRKGKEKEEE